MTVAQDPTVARRLADAVASLPPDVQTYKDVASTGAAIVEVLRELAASSGNGDKS
jgi:hypothetical protein